MRYTFGYNHIAAERLRTIAGFFNSLAEKFIQANLDKAVKTSVDLGCGPGYTTQMLAKASQADDVIGMDISDYYLELAQQQFPQLNFVKQDLTQWNSNAKYDMLYCRFLLSHMSNLNQLLTSWIDHLSPGGKLIIDELEDIYTDIPVFQQYLEMNRSLINSQGAELYIGKILNDLVKGLNILVNQSDLIHVSDSLAAQWFYPNTVGIWNEEDHVLNTLNFQQRKWVSEELLKISDKESSKSNITWKMKRIILTT